MSHLYGIILAGGSGTRLWPLSTKKTPKQFLSIGNFPSLLSQTVARVESLVSFDHLWVVCGQIHAELVSRHLPNLHHNQILTEPQAKNTAAAIALAAIHLRSQDPEAMMVVLPADHLIPSNDWPSFCKNIHLAAAVAREQRALVTLGVFPPAPLTGYGYIESGEKFNWKSEPYFRVKSFQEKPDQKTAVGYLARGGYYWNSGMFVWQAQTYLEALHQTCPSTAKVFETLSHELYASNYPQLLKESFEKLDPISVDYAVMEKAKNVFMIPANFSWDDVGSLTSFEKMLSVDEKKNHIQGEVFTIDASENMVIAQSKPVALVGVKGLVVIETPQAILVLPKEKAQDVKKMVEALKNRGQEDLL